MKNFMISIIFFVAIQTNLISQTWDTLANMPIAMTFPVVVALNGEIHVVGGSAGGSATQLHLRYKPTTNVWDTLADVPYHAQQPAGCVLNGKIHFFGGGFPTTGTPLNLHYVYDPSTDVWTPAANLPIARAIMEAGSINGKIYAISGQPDKTRMDEYDEPTDSWTLKNPLPDMNFWYAATVVRDNQMYRFGGGGFTVPQAAVHKYNSATDSWNNIASLPISLHAPAGSELGGLIYLAGGYNGGYVATTYAFDETALTFTPVASLPVPRAYHELVTIDTCIYSVGGYNSAVAGVDVSLLRYCNAANVSVKEHKDNNFISIYPNPTTGNFKIEIQNSKILSVEILNMIGEHVLISEFEIKNNEANIDLSGVSMGMYFMSVKANGKIYHQKIVKE